MSVSWRFYADADHRWRWEKASASIGVITSGESYDSYAACTEAAAQHGYVFIPAPPKIGRSPSLKQNEAMLVGTYSSSDRQEAVSLSGASAT